MSIIEQHYRVLGLSSRSCELDDVKRAYKRKALELHPDRNPNKSDEAFKRVHAAYEAILLHHRKRTNLSSNQFTNNSNKKYTDSNISCNYKNNKNNNNNNQYYNVNVNSLKQSAPYFSSYTSSLGAECTSSSFNAPPLFTEEELFGCHTIPGGWVFRDGASHKPRQAKCNNNKNNNNINCSKNEYTHTSESLPELSSSQSSMKTAYEAAELHWRQAHGQRTPVSGYKSTFHIPSEFGFETQYNGNNNNSDNNNNNSNNNNNNINDTCNKFNSNEGSSREDVKAKYNRYREEQRQNLSYLAEQHAKLNRGKMTAFEFNRYPTPEEKKAALHERWNSLEKNINNKISVADDLVNHTGNSSNNSNNINNNVNNNNNASTKHTTENSKVLGSHYSFSMSSDEAALLMAEVSAMSKKKLERQQRQREWEEEQHRKQQEEQEKEEETDKSELERKNDMEDNCNEEIDKDEINNALVDREEKEKSTSEKNKELQEDEQTEVCTQICTESPNDRKKTLVEENEFNQHRQISEAHRDCISHERRELMYQLFYQQYAPEPAVVSQMSDAELYTLLQLFRNITSKLENVCTARLASTRCSRCSKYFNSKKQTVDTNDNIIYNEINKQKDNSESMRDSNAEQKENKCTNSNASNVVVNDAINCKNKEISNENSNEEFTTTQTKVKVFDCAHVCVCIECAKWATECPLCGALKSQNIKEFTKSKNM